MIKNLFFMTLVFVTILVALPVTYADLPAVIMPGADLVLTVDFVKMREADISKKFKELGALKKELGQQGDMAQLEQFDKKLTRITGLKQEDFLRMTAAVEMDTMDLVSGKKPDFADMDAVLGVTLARVLTEDQLEKGLKAFAQQLAIEEELNAVPLVTKTSQHGTPIFKTQKPGDKEALYFSISDGGKLLLMGSEMGILGTLARQTNSERITTQTLFPASITTAVKDADMALLFQPTGAMQTRMKEDAAQAQAGPGARFGQVFSNMKGLGMAITSTNVLTFHLTGDFADKGLAEQARDLMDTQVISMVKMVVGMAAGGKAMPVLQTMKASAEENGTAQVTLSITDKDIDVFKEMMKEKAEQQNGDGAELEGEIAPVE